MSHHIILFTFYLLFQSMDVNIATNVTESERMRALFERYKSDPMYLIYILDSSGSITSSKFIHEVDFVDQSSKFFPVSVNHTRIAVVTYSTKSRIFTPINYIDNPHGKNKCTLQRDISNISYKPGSTATRSALEKAYSLLPKNDLQNVTRLLILLTDGRSSPGEHPVEFAKQIRNEGIIIISVALGTNLNYEELRDSAGSEEHLIRLENVDDITTTSNVIRGDTNDKTAWEFVSSGSCDALCSGGDCCDTHTSHCACALESGEYGCACKPGYTWSDKHHGCSPCELDHYKPVWGKQACKACPGNSKTASGGATEKSQCVCNNGYQKDSNDNCQIVKCSVLSSIANVEKVSTNCGNTLNDVCIFTCAVNYYQTGGDLQRKCQQDGLWSGKPLQCSEILCNALPNLENGYRNCSSSKLSIGTICDVTCEEGYELGSNGYVQTCEKSGNSGIWDVTIECRPVTCGVMKLHKGGDNMVLTPPECWNTSLPYESVCSIGCTNGYVLQGPKTKKCKANKTWSEGITKCKDKKRPKILNCPSNINTTTNGSNTAEVTWENLIVVDNSGKPAKIRNFTKDTDGKNTTPYTKDNRFPIGQTKVIIKARDENKNEATCKFNVTVIDDEPPIVVSCENVERNTSYSAIKVTWDEPVFADNSGKNLVITSDLKPGYEVRQGEKVLVSYKAKDPSGNVARCDFYVKVTPKSCTFQEPPKNGAIAYDSWIGGQIYRVYCQEGFQFTREPEDSYFCENGEWVLPPPNNANKADMPWPDCSAADKGTLAVDVGLLYYTTSCPGEGSKQIKKDLFQFSEMLTEFLPDACNDNCSAENVVVKCGPVDSVVGRRRRQISQQFAYAINFTLKLPVVSEETQNYTTLERSVEGISAAVRAGKLPYTVGGTALTPSEHIDVGEISITCKIGQIRRNDFCVNCPVGTFYNDGSCVRCGNGFYQDKEAQLSCVRCPAGSSTFTENSKSPLECKAPCQPGTYSNNGMEMCIVCPIGTYQNRGRQTSCFQCPTGLTTLMPGSTSLEQCIDECQPGTYSSTTLAPCTPCPLGTYQPQSRQSTCIECPRGTYTPTEGAWTKEFCRVIDECLESPCLNNGRCRDLEKGYRCVCSKGFTGVNCEININECAPGICQNGGTCVDQNAGFLCVCPDGYKGKNCQTDVDDCQQNQCNGNSKCVDGVNSYTCECDVGFTGTLCDINYDDCIGNPCMNGGSCFDDVGNFTCCCPPGYEGWTCADEVDECQGHPCLNEGICIDEFNSYRCLCPAGYVGLDCEIEVNECHNVTCVNGGSCHDLINDFKCVCRLGFIGTFCQIELSSNFDLSLASATVSNYAIYRDLPDLYAFTISFWMKTSDNVNYGTPISYATTGLDGSIIDNAITLLNYNNFILDINGEHIYTGIKANDGIRHHICITWDSIDGSWSIYLDRVLKSSGNGVQIGNFIKGGGTFVIGQEQDSLGGSFIQFEAFVGLISQVNVFDYVLTTEERLILSTSCGVYGNVLAWPLIATTVQGGLVPVYASSICSDVDVCFISPCLNGGSCENVGSGYLCNCPIGYQGHHCELVSAFCDHQSCANGALCQDGTSESFCICPLGFHGIRCENKTDMCMVEQRNCLNGGRCITNDGKAVCDCPKGWTGNHCQYDLNECLENNGNCDHACVNGPGSFNCECRDGFALQPDGTTCNDVSFCVHEWTLHRIGETWSDGKCSDCSCVDGRAKCARRKCPDLACGKNEQSFNFPGTCCPSCISEPSICTILPKGKLWTFDDQYFDSNGDCRYIISRDYVTGNFSIQLEHNQYYTKRAIFLDIDCVTVHIDFSGSVTISGVPVKLPYLHGNPKNVLVSRFGSMGVSVVTNRGVKIIWKENGKVIVYVPRHYQRKTEGLCGNMNNNKKDDTLTRQKMPAKSTKELVHSWKVEGYKYCKEEVEKPVVEDNNDHFPACIGKHQYVLEYARSQCEDIVIGPLSACHSQVDPRKYYSLCMQDSCVCGLNIPCYCESLSAYVTECQRQNVNLQKYIEKLSTCGVSCGPGFVYNDCGPSPECQPTCYDDKKNEAKCISWQCEPGCHCPAGHVVHQDKCIRKSECPNL